MTRSIHLRFLLLAATIAWGAPEKVLPPGSRVAVLDPWSASFNDRETRVIGDSIRAFFDRNVAVVPGLDAPKSTANRGPCADLACARELARTIGADRVVFGTWSAGANGMTLALSVASSNLPAVLWTTTETRADSVPLGRFSMSVAQHLWDGPSSAPVVDREAQPPADQTEILKKMKRLAEERDAAWSSAWMAGITTPLLFLGTLGTASRWSDCDDQRSASPNAPSCGYERNITLVLLVATIADGAFWFSRIDRRTTLDNQIKELEKKRRLSLQILPYVDPVHGSAGLFARAGF